MFTTKVCLLLSSWRDFRSTSFNPSRLVAPACGACLFLAGKRSLLRPEIAPLVRHEPWSIQPISLSALHEGTGIGHRECLHGELRSAFILSYEPCTNERKRTGGAQTERDVYRKPANWCSPAHGNDPSRLLCPSAYVIGMRCRVQFSVPLNPSRMCHPNLRGPAPQAGVHHAFVWSTNKLCAT